jgi:hypothetical protein
MGSDVRDAAVPAVEELRREGWLYNGSLRVAALRYANLEGARLWGANLEMADLWGANLKGAFLLSANLSRANLEGAQARAGQLYQAENLEGATLPDGNTLSEDNWKAEFEEWRRKQEARAASKRGDDDDGLDGEDDA